MYSCLPSMLHSAIHVLPLPPEHTAQPLLPGQCLLCRLQQYRSPSHAAGLFNHLLASQDLMLVTSKFSSFCS